VLEVFPPATSRLQVVEPVALRQLACRCKTVRWEGPRFTRFKRFEIESAQYRLTKRMKQTIALILFAILAAGCATQPPKPDPATNLVAEVEQSKDGKITKQQYTTWNVVRMFKLYGGEKGYVTIEDWRRLQGPSRDALFKSLDVNHDGKVTLAEAEANPRVRALLGGNFNDIDTNHDGSIDRQEAAAYLAKKQAYTP